MSEPKRVNRRKFIAGGAAVVAAAAVGGAAYYLSQAPPPSVTSTAGPLATTSVAPVATTSPTAYPANSQNPLVMNIWGYHPEVVQDNIRIFDQMYGTPDNPEAVNVEIVSDDYTSSMETKFMAGLPIDVCYAMDFHAHRFYKAGWIHDTSDMRNSDVVPYNINDIQTEFYPTIREDLTIPGTDKYVGLPYFTSDHGAILTNEDLLDKAGLSGDYPTTYAELYANVEKIAKKGFKEPYLPYWWNGWQAIGEIWHAETINRAGPEAMFDPKTFDPTFDVNTEAAAVLKDWKYLYDNNLAPRGIFTLAEGDFISWFATGKYAYAPNHHYDIRAYNDPTLSKIAGKCSIVPSTSKQSWGLLSLGIYLMVERKGRSQHDIERAQALQQFFGYKDKTGAYFIGKKWAMEFALGAGYPAILKDPEVVSAYEKWMFRPEDLETISNNLSTAPSPPVFKNFFYVEWQTGAVPYLQAAVSGQKTIDEVITYLRQRAFDLKKKYGE
jgi:ABC-type glycerol-3-phosphate transport system substrate-binding protein